MINTLGYLSLKLKCLKMVVVVAVVVVIVVLLVLVVQDAVVEVVVVFSDVALLEHVVHCNQN